MYDAMIAASPQPDYEMIQEWLDAMHNGELRGRQTK